jgi:hypothetical protein
VEGRDVEAHDTAPDLIESSERVAADYAEHFRDALTGEGRGEGRRALRVRLLRRFRRVPAGRPGVELDIVPGNGGIQT